MTSFREFNNVLPKWQMDIVDKYPFVYFEPNPNLRAWYSEEDFNKLIAEPNFCNLRYGFEFDSGWSDIVDKFSSTAENLVKVLRARELQRDAYIHSCIFKQKFGTLCYQGDHNLVEPFSTLFNNYIVALERKSATVCQLLPAKAW